MTSLAEGADREDVAGPITAGEGERSGSNPPLTGTRYWMSARCMPLLSPGCCWATSVPT